jgi:CBS domain-containing membrane protein
LRHPNRGAARAAAAHVLTVREIMSAPPVTVDRTDTLAFAEELMNVESIRHLPVVDGDVLLGLVSQRDVLAASISTLGHSSVEDDIERKRKVEVAQVMHGDIETVTAETPLAAAADTILAQKVGCLPVVDERHHLVGIVTRTDLVRVARDLLTAAPVRPRPARPRRGSPARR